jgi:hypothetical protein
MKFDFNFFCISNLNSKYILINNQQAICNFNIEWNSFGKIDVYLMMAVCGRHV